MKSIIAGLLVGFGFVWAFSFYVAWGVPEEISFVRFLSAISAVVCAGFFHAARVLK